MPRTLLAFKWAAIVNSELHQSSRNQIGQNQPIKPMKIPCCFYTLLMFAILATAEAAKPPNILFILADDLGYTDVNAFAQKATGTGKEKMFYETPHIDQLAASGLAFSQAYAYQLCSPTRASLLTGKNAPSLGFTTATPQTARSFYALNQQAPAGYLALDARYWGDPIKSPQALLNGGTLLALPAGRLTDQGRDELTFAEALTGYRSAFIGKWHVGGHGAEGYQPHNQGFEEIAYFDAGGSPFFKWQELWNRKTKNDPTMPQKELLWGKSGENTREAYLTDNLTTQADRFIRSHHQTRPGQPFLLYFCQFAVHSPIQAKPEDVGYFQKKSTKGWNGHTDSTYAAMIRSLDQSVGRLMATLDELDLTENTLVVFMSDNGGVSYLTKKGDTPTTSNTPFKGGKAMMFEGGIRVPLIFHWPAAIPAGNWSDVPVAASDLFPTLVQAGGIDPESLRSKHEIDGKSLIPLFKDPSNKNKGYLRDTFIWHYPFNVAPLHPDDGFPLTPHSAIRKGDFKLIFDWNGRLWLYDIKNDPFEKQNLAESMPGKTREWFKELNDWLDANVATKYMPALNPDYDSQTDPRARPFMDLRRQFLGPHKAIRPAAGDPRLEQLHGL
jgi:arylsulfatase A-like enzyme